MLNKIVFWFLNKLFKRNEFESIYLRNIYKKYFGIEVGMYSYGCFDRKRIPKGTRIGRYCSFAPTVYIFHRNHGLDYMSLHPYLYNDQVGIVNGLPVMKETVCEIEDDVWLGHNSIITPSVDFIGRGAVVAAGAVVTKNVPRYAVVAGNPAKVIRYRFNSTIIKTIEETEWWLLSKDEFKIFVESNKSYVYDPRGNL